MMANLHTEDTFMWENVLIDDYDKDYAPGRRICIDDATPADWDALADKRLRGRGVNTPQERSLKEMLENAEDWRMYNDNDGEIMHDPMKKQVNGSHYNKYSIQPAEYCYKNKLNNLQSEAISYITRYPDKGGKVDLEKAIHTLEILIHMEYGDGYNG